jgi:hypothetical protein
MSVQINNLQAKCLDRNSPHDLVLHEVRFDLQNNGQWEPKSMEVLATDPMDAIETVRSLYGRN